ncbi:hypothetical protein AG1IA_02296 [Rhizoctonia solani AG-1 IA]|uniref:Uncharacterized protein n=1 Tax=Thanatephorus cucumeris (strain AG1-IA) TaxID=983506 RepID=L8X3Q9_THACA|nr:hypothetical protein AG1IA_02296 [Rhizoctonia solani AG-1 IA]
MGTGAVLVNIEGPSTMDSLGVSESSPGCSAMTGAGTTADVGQSSASVSLVQPDPAALVLVKLKIAEAAQLELALVWRSSSSVTSLDIRRASCSNWDLKEAGSQQCTRSVGGESSMNCCGRRRRWGSNVPRREGWMRVQHECDSQCGRGQCGVGCFRV